MARTDRFTFEHDSPAAGVRALVERVRPVETERVALGACAGRVLAEAIVADRPSPAAAVSSMDGFAVRAAEVGAGRLRVVGEVRIGREPAGMGAEGRVCVRIVTGGAVPAGADAVVKREDVVERDGAIEVARGEAVRAGQNIRQAGENLMAGAVAVGVPCVVTAAVAGALSTFGVVRPKVFRRVRVSVLTTGDEVVRAEERPTAWQVRDANGTALSAMLGGRAWVEHRHEHVGDDEGAMGDAVGRALEWCDALLLTGGVSMGHRDYVTGALERAGVGVVFHGLPQKPGKPALGGVAADGRPVLGLPGNPVSVLVTGHRLALPALRARAGLREVEGARGVVELDAAIGASELWQHRLVRLVGVGAAELMDARSSGDIAGAARADGFVEAPPGRVDRGPYAFYPWWE